MFSCLAGFAPQAADQRLQNDKLASAKKLWGGQYSDQLLEIIDWCLQLNYMDRPQSVFQLQKAILEKFPEPPPKKPKLLDSIRQTLSKEIF